MLVLTFTFKPGNWPCNNTGCGQRLLSYIIGNTVVHREHPTGVETGQRREVCRVLQMA